LPNLYQLLKNIAGKAGFMGLYFTNKVRREDFFLKPDFSMNQFFFNKSTAGFLVATFDRYNDICCLCTPRLAHEWFERGRTVALLDIDERFSYLPGYTYFELRNPIKLTKEFDLIIADPPFSMTAYEIRRAIDVITSQRFEITLCIIFPIDRENELLTAFSEWNLRHVPFQNLQWNNIKSSYHNLYRFYSNRHAEINKPFLPNNVR